MATEPEHEGRYRVYAVESAKDGVVRAYGGGWFIGYHRPPNGTPSCFGPIDDDLGPEFTNPCIQLDDDRGVVWGCQCWWGVEEKARARFADYTEVLVPPPASSSRRKRRRNHARRERHPRILHQCVRQC